MKNFILILVVVLLAWTKVEDELVITNTYPKSVSLILNGQKRLEVLTPNESVSYLVSGLNNVQLLYMNETLLDTIVLVDGLTYIP